MQTYKLHTLLLFLKAQQKINFEAIEIILGILEDEALPDEDKTDGILFILHKYGLNEITRKNGDYKPILESCKLPEKEMKPLGMGNYHECFIVQALTLEILNGYFIGEIALN